MIQLTAILSFFVCINKLSCQIAVDTFIDRPQDKYFFAVDLGEGVDGKWYANDKSVSREKYNYLKKTQDSLWNVKDTAKYIKRLDRRGRVILVGGWDRDAIRGNYVYYFKNGNKDEEVNYPDNNESKTGHYISYWESGKKKREGDYGHQQKRIGKWIYYDKNGKVIKEIQYNDLNRSGHCISYWKNGQKKSEGDYTYEDSNPIGKWVCYNKHEKMIKEKQY